MPARQRFGRQFAKVKNGSYLLHRCGYSQRGRRNGDGLFDRIAESMPHQDMALLNAWRFVRRRRDQHIDKFAHAASGGPGEPNCKNAHLASDREGFQDTLGISGSADTDGHVSGDRQSLELSREHLFIAVIVGDGCNGGSIGMKGHGRQWTALAQIASQEFRGKMLRIRGAAAISEEERLVTAAKGRDERVGRDGHGRQTGF